MNFPVYFIKVEICVNLTAYNKQIIKKDTDEKNS
jgi:hypothetical protein